MIKKQIKQGCQPIILIYHDPCADGIGAAWAAKTCKKNAILVPYNLTNPNFIIEDYTTRMTNAIVIFADCCFPLDELRKVCQIASNVVVLDHHKSNIELLKNFVSEKDNVTLVLDNKRSGCQIAWDYFFPQQSRPWFIDYIGDRDLWAFNLEYSKEINAALWYLGYLSLAGLSILSNHLEEVIKPSIIDYGIELERYNKQQICSDAMTAVLADLQTPIAKYRVLVVTGITYNKSEVGNYLIKLCDSDHFTSKPVLVMLPYYIVNSHKWGVSMRSADNKMDLTQICKELNSGGGHRNAAGLGDVSSISDILTYVDDLPGPIADDIRSVLVDNENSPFIKSVHHKRQHDMLDYNLPIMELSCGDKVIKGAMISHNPNVNIDTIYQLLVVGNENNVFLVKYTYSLKQNLWEYTFYAENDILILISLYKPSDLTLSLQWQPHEFNISRYLSKNPPDSLLHK